MSAEPATSNGRRRASNGHADRQHTTLASRRSRQDGQDRARIETLTTEANRCHLAAKRAEQDYTRNAMGAGAALLKLKELVKEIVGYGHWDQWLQKNRDSLGFAPRTARLYMQLAELPDTERQRVADLQLREAARTLATRNPLGRRRDPTLGAPLAAVVDGVVKLVRADVVVAYLHALQTPNECSPDRFREGARWVEQQLASSEVE